MRRMKIRFAALTIRAWWELVRYDLVNAVAGFKGIHSQLARQPVASEKPQQKAEAEVCEAVSLSACFYFRPVLCLQRSAATTRLLRKYGVQSHLLIGYRAAPFFSHAWVEVDNRVVNDSPVYKDRLQVLVTI
jgi:hypothetical protein